MRFVVEFEGGLQAFTNTIDEVELFTIIIRTARARCYRGSKYIAVHTNKKLHLVFISQLLCITTLESSISRQYNRYSAPRSIPRDLNKTHSARKLNLKTVFTAHIPPNLLHRKDYPARTAQLPHGEIRPPKNVDASPSGNGQARILLKLTTAQLYYFFAFPQH